MNGVSVRQRIADADAGLAERFWQNAEIDDLLAERAALFDRILGELWETHLPAAARAQMALYAVGGYGRAELHPGSDIDLLILVKRRSTWAADIEGFVQSLWDLGCEIGHSVRTVRECRRESAADITTATAMFERRLLFGAEKLIRSLDRAMAARRLWPSAKFFVAKRDEQAARHQNFDNIEYGLEPNIKSSPGGLRDLHTVFWIVRREFGTNETSLLCEQGVLTAQEEEWLLEGKRFLSWVRYGLHLIAGRKEDRLQFEYQRELAQRFGYADTDAKRGVEGFMQLYYRHVLALREVNDIVLQTFEETIVQGRRRPRMEQLNDRFRLRNRYIETTHDGVFADTPSALLELFVIMANRRDIAGVRASTIRDIRDSLYLIDENFRNDPNVVALFLQLMQSPYTLVSQLTRMRRYGILGKYLPEFGSIVGQMQHDLFHIYTVDAHTMTVIGNMRKFRYRKAEETYPVAHACVLAVPKIELLYIAGLYHDIGKGRGGDHSQLGAVDAAKFCERHGMSVEDTDLVCWLVRAHLLMSATAQRKDIHDPDVIAEFAREVGNQTRLDYLYALTAADITATNPTLWNSWRASLLRQLYQHTRGFLKVGAERDREALLARRKADIADAFFKKRLKAGERADLDVDAEAALLVAGENTFSQLPDHLVEFASEEFCFRYEPEVAADILVECDRHDISTGPMIVVRDLPGQLASENVTEIVAYASDRIGLFRDTVSVLEKNKLAVYNAFIQSTKDDRCLNAFIVLAEQGKSLTTQATLYRQVKGALRDALSETKSADRSAGSNINSNTPSETSSRSNATRPTRASSGNRKSQARLPRQRQQMITPSKVTLHTEEGAEYSLLTIITTDRPGLLARISELFNEIGILVCSARINTLGNQVEDFFEITQEDDTPFTDPEQIYTISNSIRQRLDLS